MVCRVICVATPVIATAKAVALAARAERVGYRSMYGGKLAVGLNICWFGRILRQCQGKPSLGQKNRHAEQETAPFPLETRLAGRRAAVAFERNPVERRKTAGSLPETNTDRRRQLRYESNPKHSDRSQRGRRGSLCPKSITPDVAKRLLADSTAVGQKRYAVHEGKAYRAQEHHPDVWHGYPVGWAYVPEKLRREWKGERRLRRRDEKRHWEVDPP